MNFPVILKVRTGSWCHGTELPGSDEDIRGICIPPIDYFLGVKKFEQFEDKENDVVIYGIEKFINLTCKGNLSALNFLFVDSKDIRECSAYGKRLIFFRNEFLSMRTINNVFGFVKSQIHKMGRSHGDCGNRKDLVDKYGYDTKFAYHAVMLTNIGIELLKTNTYHPLRPPKEQQHLKQIRIGIIKYDEVMAEIGQNLTTMKTLESLCGLPKECDKEKISDFMVEFLKDYFGIIKKELVK